MPTGAHDRIGRRPFSALLILLTLLLGSANAAAAAGNGVRAPSARFGSGRHGPATALLATATRTSSDDDASGSGTGPLLGPSRPGIVTRRLWTLPQTEFPVGLRAAAPEPPGAYYRARAPPAS